MIVKFKKLTPEAVAPKQGTCGSAGFDLTATSVFYDEDLQNVHYGSGIAVEIPEGHVGLLFPRSSIYKKGLHLTNSVGVIDSDYRGEVKAVFRGSNADLYEIGERFAQLIIVPIPTVSYIEADELSQTERGTGGYGSTGK